MNSSPKSHLSTLFSHFSSLNSHFTHFWCYIAASPTIIFPAHCHNQDLKTLLVRHCKEQPVPPKRESNLSKLLQVFSIATRASHGSLNNNTYHPFYVGSFSELLQSFSVGKILVRLIKNICQYE